MKRLLCALGLIIATATAVSAQVVGQGAPATTSDANAWPVKVVFGGAQIDPRAVTVQNASLTVDSELAAAAALADNFANPTTAPAGAFVMVWDGATWDRWTGAVTVTGSVTVTDGAGALNVIVDSGTITTITNAVTVTDGAGALNTIIDSGTVTAVTSITNPVTVTDGSGALNTIVDSGTLTAVTSITNAVTVAGAAADGAAVSGNPVRIAGSDGTNTQNIVTDTDGNLQVDVLTLPNVTIGTFPDNEPINIAQMNGVAVTMGNGASGTGVQRVTIASDSTGQVAVASLPNEGQQTAANSISVTPDTDNDAIGATGAAPPGEVIDVGGRTSGADTTGLLTALTICTDHVAVDIVTATTTLVITGVANRHVRICAINLVTAAANNVALIAGTGATCGTSTAGINGGTTAAEGWNFAANGGIAQGGGIGEIMSTKVSGGATGDSVCIITSAATQLSGTISYAIY